MRACVRACVRAFVRACVRACVRVLRASNSTETRRNSHTPAGLDAPPCVAGMRLQQQDSPAARARAAALWLPLFSRQQMRVLGDGARVLRAPRCAPLCVRDDDVRREGVPIAPARCVTAPARASCKANGKVLQNLQL